MFRISRNTQTNPATALNPSLSASPITTQSTQVSAGPGRRLLNVARNLFAALRSNGPTNSRAADASPTSRGPVFTHPAQAAAGSPLSTPRLADVLNQWAANDEEAPSLQANSPAPPSNPYPWVGSSPRGQLITLLKALRVCLDANELFTGKVPDVVGHAHALAANRATSTAYPLTQLLYARNAQQLPSAQSLKSTLGHLLFSETPHPFTEMDPWSELMSTAFAEVVETALQQEAHTPQEVAAKNELLKGLALLAMDLTASKSESMNETDPEPKIALGILHTTGLDSLSDLFASIYPHDEAMATFANTANLMRSSKTRILNTLQKRCFVPESDAAWAYQNLRCQELLSAFVQVPTFDVNKAPDYLRLDPEFILYVLKHNVEAVRNLPDELRRNLDFAKAAVQVSSEAFQYLTEFHDDYEVACLALDNQKGGLEAGYSSPLEHLSDRLKLDRGLVLRSVQASGETLMHALPQFKGDPVIARAAVQQAYSAIEFVTQPLKAELAEDRDLALDGINADALNMHYISEAFRDDEQIALAASHAWGPFGNTSTRIRSDVTIGMQAVKNNFRNMQYLIGRAAIKPEIIKEALKGEAQFRQTATPEEKADYERELRSQGVSAITFHYANHPLAVNPHLRRNLEAYVISHFNNELAALQ
ncbi:MAG: DUF4116 domain-containing protein [Limnobacter sp.]|nr:DUF4116 domain-containing protein [Limnobacter sp.]